MTYYDLQVCTCINLTKMKIFLTHIIVAAKVNGYFVITSNNASQRKTLPLGLPKNLS